MCFPRLCLPAFSFVLCFFFSHLCLGQQLPPGLPLQYGSAAPGILIKNGVKLRILPVGDSITVGQYGDDGNGYRLKLRQNLSPTNDVVFAGTQADGSMDDPYHAAWSGKTIQYMIDNLDASLAHRPNIILLHAGTNDMDTPALGASERLGLLIDKMFVACPDAVILVAMIINTCRTARTLNTNNFQELTAQQVQMRQAAGKHVIAVDFTQYPISLLLPSPDCIHPTSAGYRIMGDWWYDFITQIPKPWITAPVGPDPVRDVDANAITRNGGPNPNIPAVDWGTSPLIDIGPAARANAYNQAKRFGKVACNGNPRWYHVGKITSGAGVEGERVFRYNWATGGIVLPATNLDPKYVRFADMDGDGKADYVWIHPATGLVRVWLNRYPNAWVKAGNDDGIIANGRGPSDSIFLADMNGDGKADYLVVNPDTGAAHIYWNLGPDAGWAHGWKFVDGGEVASGTAHANWKTLRLADMNGDKRADYMTVGVGGSVLLFMNRGTEVTPVPVNWMQGVGITGGPGVTNLDHVVFADIDGDGRADYLVFNDQGAVSVHLNIMTQKNNVPLFAPPNLYASGVSLTTNFRDIRIADINGDGKADYIYIAPNGAAHWWINNGKADTSRGSDSVRFADMDGDGVDDYVVIGHDTGSVRVVLNKGMVNGVWNWQDVNNQNSVVTGNVPATQVWLADRDGDGRADYLFIDPVSGNLREYRNVGAPGQYSFVNVGGAGIALGWPARRIRFADMTGDGKADIILLDETGGIFVFGIPGEFGRTNYNPDEVQFVDVNGDGRADFVWTRKIDGVSRAVYNYYPATNRWRDGGEVASGVVNANGQNVRWAKMQPTGRASYVVLDPATGAPAVWANWCAREDVVPPVFQFGCPDPTSTCQMVDDDDGTCNFGYDVCLEKMGCSNKPGETDCIGTSIGCAHCGTDPCPPEICWWDVV